MTQMAEQKTVAQLPPGRVQKLTLEPSTLDWQGHQTQMVLGLVAILLVVLVNFAGTLHIGFLLDDLLHVDQAVRALHGDHHDLIANLYSNWGGSDLMRSFRPLASLSVFADASLYGINACGYHITNLILYTACASLVALVTLELTGMHGNRLRAAPAIWAGLLFAVYPLHPEAEAWMIGRVDLLCTLFYLASTFCFLRYRLIRERSYFPAALVFAALSMASKEMAVTLPLIISMCALLPVQSVTGTGLAGRRQDLRLSLFFWALLGLFAVLRTCLLGTTVGGYSNGSFETMALEAVRHFADRASWLKVLFPCNEEMIKGKALLTLLGCTYGLLGTLVASRIVLRQAHPYLFAFLLAWVFIAVLPTFQVWHIYPNLVGSRLFFLSSAPLCILIALSSTPAVELCTRSFARVWAILGSFLLVVILTSWSFALQKNMEPWLIASRQLTQMHKQLIELAQTQPEKKTLLIDLPTDYKGAGQVTRPQYLALLLGPTFSKHDYTSCYDCLVPRENLERDLVQPAQLQEVTSGKFARILQWQKSAGAFVAWTPPSGAHRLNIKFGNRSCESVTPESNSRANESTVGSPTRDREIKHSTSIAPGLRSAPTCSQLSYPLLTFSNAQTSQPPLQEHPMNTRQWHAISAQKPEYWFTDSSLIVSIPATHRKNVDYDLLLPTDVDPLKIKAITVKAAVVGENKPFEQICSLIWRSSQTPELHELPLEKQGANVYGVAVQQHRSWCFNGRIQQVGFRLKSSGCTYQFWQLN